MAAVKAEFNEMYGCVENKRELVCVGYGATWLLDVTVLTR